MNMNYGREDELESDDLGVRIMSEAGYDPRGMIRVMEILAEASGGGQRQPACAILGLFYAPFQEFWP